MAKDGLRIGLIARADITGLGIQTRDFYRHMKPDHVMIVDLQHLSGRPMNPSWYPDADSVVKYVPYPDTPVLKTPEANTKAAIDRMLQQVDLVFTCETVYDYYLIHAAQKKGVKVVLQYNFELLDHVHNMSLPQPDLFMAPSMWRYEDVPFGQKLFVPVPVDREIFQPREWDSPVVNQWVHPGGNPVMEDRNGTLVAMEAFHHTKSEAKLKITTPQPRLASNHRKVIVARGLAAEPQDNYVGADGFLFPRKFGGLCLPLNEAMSMGMPCLMTGISPQSEFLPGEVLVSAPEHHIVYTKTDIAVHEPDAVEVADVIDRLATDPELVADVRERTAALGEKISWPKMIQFYDDAFRTICSGYVPEQRFTWS